MSLKYLAYSNALSMHDREAIILCWSYFEIWLKEYLNKNISSRDIKKRLNNKETGTTELMNEFFAIAFGSSLREFLNNKDKEELWKKLDGVHVTRINIVHKGARDIQPWYGTKAYKIIESVVNFIEKEFKKK